MSNLPTQIVLNRGSANDIVVHCERGDGGVDDLTGVQSASFQVFESIGAVSAMLSLSQSSIDVVNGTITFAITKAQSDALLVGSWIVLLSLTLSNGKVIKPVSPFRIEVLL